MKVQNQVLDTGNKAIDLNRIIFVGDLDFNSRYAVYVEHGNYWRFDNEECSREEFIKHWMESKNSDEKLFS